MNLPILTIDCTKPVQHGHWKETGSTTNYGPFSVSRFAGKQDVGSRNVASVVHGCFIMAIWFVKSILVKGFAAETRWTLRVAWHTLLVNKISPGFPASALVSSRIRGGGSLHSMGFFAPITAHRHRQDQRIQLCERLEVGYIYMYIYLPLPVASGSYS